MNETGITDITASFVYRNRATSEESNMAPSAIGDYTVTATVTIGDSYNYNCTLTKDFSILAGYKVNNIYSQFSLSKSSALEGEEVTITYTQLMDEILEGLTLTGATSGNNVTYTQSGNIYTFTMPAEDVNLNATITYTLNENDITQNDNTYTIKTADGWNYLCRRLEVDGELKGFSGKTVVLAGNITVTTMAGSTDHPFKGTFDGDGHTLTFNYTADRTNCAPFRITDGATIRNSCRLCQRQSHHRELPREHPNQQHRQRHCQQRRLRGLTEFALQPMLHHGLCVRRTHLQLEHLEPDLRLRRFRRRLFAVRICHTGRLSLPARPVRQQQR